MLNLSRISLKDSGSGRVRTLDRFIHFAGANNIISRAFLIKLRIKMSLGKGISLLNKIMLNNPSLSIWVQTPYQISDPKTDSSGYDIRRWTLRYWY